MIQPTHEFHQHRHADHTARLRSAMHRQAPFSARRSLGSWLVAVGLWLAPDASLRRQALELSEYPETDPVSGYSLGGWGVPQRWTRNEPAPPGNCI